MYTILVIDPLHSKGKYLYPYPMSEEEAKELLQSYKDTNPNTRYKLVSVIEVQAQGNGMKTIYLGNNIVKG